MNRRFRVRVALTVAASILAIVAGCTGRAVGSSTVRQIITTPYANGPYGKGTAGTGLEIKGSRGYGGTPLMVTDYQGAPEVWVRNGSLYIGYKAGWMGGRICIDNDLRTDTCLTLRDIRYLHRIEART